MDQGRVKINDRLFTGITSYSPWNFINSGVTGFSLEVSGNTSSPNGNNDTSSSAGNLFVGTGNTVGGAGGYNFIQGINNSISNSKNSFISGTGNTISYLTDSFVFGENNKISSGNSITINPGTFIVFSSNTLNNNYASILGSKNVIIEKKPSSTTPQNNFLTVLSNSNLFTSADTNFVTALPGNNNVFSGSVSNSVIYGLNNMIGSGITTVNDNIYIFGNGISSILSAGTTIALSGTYINNLCIEDSLMLNYENISISSSVGPGSSISAATDFTKNNVFLVGQSYHLFPVPGIATAQTLNNFFSSSINGSGLFFIVWADTSYMSHPGGTFIGNSSYFYDDFYNNVFDIKSNIYSANTNFFTYSNYLDKYIRYKG